MGRLNEKKQGGFPKSIWSDYQMPACQHQMPATSHATIVRYLVPNAADGHVTCLVACSQLLTGESPMMFRID